MTFRHALLTHEQTGMGHSNQSSCGYKLVRLLVPCACTQHNRTTTDDGNRHSPLCLLAKRNGFLELNFME